eukprot:TRINITY_DN75_c0_g1_i10.p1 TRINITY_DN75_c0_g1~~TRINITY_DN75_c0_g1_i10.p1  ORF type:complete len:511 (-),score=34.92 TRINITY_DN75_c0_g1_i10:816-2348(-)
MLDRLGSPRWRKRGYAMGEALQLYRPGWRFGDEDGCRRGLGIEERDVSMWEVIERCHKLETAKFSKVETASNVMPRRFGKFLAPSNGYGDATRELDAVHGVRRHVVLVEENEEEEGKDGEAGEAELQLATETQGRDQGCKNSVAWADLPEDLQIRILTDVPYTHLMRSRAVCKSWNSLILSPEFCKIHVDKPAVCRSYFPMLLQKKGNRQVVCYDFACQNWLELPFFSFLPSDVNHMNRKRRQTPFPIFGAGGLLCCTKEASDGGCVLTVFNPLTRSWKELPLVAAKLSCDDCFHMVVQDGGKSYQIVAAEADRSKEIYVYSSLSNSWLVVPLPVRCQGWSFLGRTAICNGMVYCAIGACDIIAYDLEHGVWIDVIDTLPDCFFLLKRLIACDGQMFGVAVRRHCEFSSFILQLKLDTLEWVVASQFPKDLDGYPWLQGRELSANAQCVADQGRLCFTDKVAERWIMLAYDIAKEAWSLLPACPYFDAADSGEYQVVSSAFQPNFGVTLG